MWQTGIITSQEPTTSTFTVQSHSFTPKDGGSRFRKKYWYVSSKLQCNITSHHSLTDDVLLTNREYKHSTGEQQILSLRMLVHRLLKKGYKNFGLSFSLSGNQPYLLWQCIFTVFLGYGNYDITCIHWIINIILYYILNKFCNTCGHHVQNVCDGLDAADHRRCDRSS